MTQALSTQILSDIVVHNKYARYIESESRRESWEDIVQRNVDMHLEKYPHMAMPIEDAYSYVRYKDVLPSMRSMQFAGKPIVRNPSRIYNCAYMPASQIEFFSELMFLLLGGTGLGYSVQRRHISQLPPLKGVDTDKRRRRYVVGDSIEGWADAIKVLVESYFLGKAYVSFDYADIRLKGTPLKTSGGLAPGAAPLREAIEHLRTILEEASGRLLTTLEIHDMACHLADAVLAGGIRRAAMICLFDKDDMSMLTCKAGTWYEQNPQRGRANNSVILLRGSISKPEFLEIWNRVKLSGSGEPGIYWTNNLDWGTNPCCEIALKPFQFCNLTDVNVSDVEDQEDLNSRVSAAAFIGTLQAGYTNFHYLRPIWQDTTEQDALIGVGMTGIGSGNILSLDLTEAAEVAKSTNAVVAHQIGINIASRVTTVKPSGTSSIVLGCSSGVHAWHAPYYVRRMRLSKVEPLYRYLADILPDMVEDSFFNPVNEAVLSIPQAAPKDAILRDESAMHLFSRAMKFNMEWVRPGFTEGLNDNNVSCTLSLKEEEWVEIGHALWANRANYNGMSVIPYDGGSYVQAPFEDISKYMYEKLEGQLHFIDLSKVSEYEDYTDLAGEAACAGGVCEIT